MISSFLLEGALLVQASKPAPCEAQQPNQVEYPCALVVSSGMTEIHNWKYTVGCNVVNDNFCTRHSTDFQIIEDS